MLQKIITICNAKGGVGKTTSTASIGACMAMMGKKVLLVDLDGQANLTLYFIPDDDAIEVSIFDSLVDGVPLPVINVKANLDLVPSSLEMASAEIALTNLIAREQLLGKLLSEVKDRYDYILLTSSLYNFKIAENSLFGTSPVGGYTLARKVAPPKKVLLNSYIIEYQ